MEMTVKINTDFSSDTDLQRYIIDTAIQKALADIYGLMSETLSEAQKYQDIAGKMFCLIEDFQNEYPDEFIRKMRMTGLISMRGAQKPSVISVAVNGTSWMSVIGSSRCEVVFLGAHEPSESATIAVVAIAARRRLSVFSICIKIGAAKITSLPLRSKYCLSLLKLFDFLF